ncbi:capsular exopolysaccharide family protein [Paenisporosarcina sp. HGH0030]|uniref:CpsD/CapB family tyrosine-protein kinase n=1 Tax=Paenisporosarcina sp. HGH0030 TaxID=1078085 RepID=UPI00034E3A0B|nr:CpsD/CapB family tyrosine-protein kinase [Paenisporosarcina sp. HGH0030]EPD53878.1 capsular exopolysaccharide family protein [Paenisporosarcina sp. HGH0030]
MANRMNKKMETQLITIENSKSPISEQYRTLRTNIQYSSVDKELKSIIITSPNPGEGKSTTIANLAIVFAQQGKKVLLVDADLRKPTIHYTFNINNTKGLTNLLMKKASLGDVIQQTPVLNLFLLPSGTIPPYPAELLQSEMMSQLMDRLKASFDLILFDTPPILAVADAQILANKCDGSILVVKSGSTEKEGAVRSKDILMSSRSKLLGVVLNNKMMKDSPYQTTYYYGQIK